MQKRWKIKVLTEKAKILSKELDLSPIVVQVLLNRNLLESELKEFLNPQDASLHSPFLLPDINVAVERIKKAILEKEKILIFGDYDVDGVTSLTIFNEYIKDTGADFSFYIPHRLNEGYGLNSRAIEDAALRGTSLIICFDCGTNSYQEIELAKKSKIDVIVVDHHKPKPGKNSPLAFINPKRADSNYPFKELSSGALSFKLVQALKNDDCFELLDLVSLSIVCDVVPLRGENRVLLHKGIQCLKSTKRPSINALCDASGVKQYNIDTFHLGFILGPRINAAGRVNSAKESLKMFMSQDYETAKNYAIKLGDYNRERRDIESKVLKEANISLEAEAENSHVLVVHNQGWHTGVLGIVASRLVDKHYKPVFVIGFDEALGRGSARSTESLNLMDVLKDCEDHLSAYGGHKKAAGIEIAYKDIEAFKKKINQVAKDMQSAQDLIPILNVDLELSFKDIGLGLATEIGKLKPFGEGNRMPVFVTREVSVKQLPKKINRNIFSVWLSQNGFTYEGTFFARNGFADMLKVGDKFDIAYSIELNYYHKTSRLILKDVIATKS